MRSMLRMKSNLRWDTSVDAPKQHIMPVVVVKDSGRLSSCLARAMEIFDPNQENVEHHPKQNISKAISYSQESLLEMFCEEADASDLKNDEGLSSLSSPTKAIDNDEKLRKYIRGQFKPFYYHSNKQTIKYTDEQRKLVFEFVKECATNTKIRQSVSID